MPRSAACDDNATDADATAEHPSCGREVARVNRALSRIAPTGLRHSAVAALRRVIGYRTRTMSSVTLICHQKFIELLECVKAADSQFSCRLSCAPGFVTWKTLQNNVRKEQWLPMLSVYIRRLLEPEPPVKLGNLLQQST